MFPVLHVQLGLKEKNLISLFSVPTITTPRSQWLLHASSLNWKRSRVVKGENKNTSYFAVSYPVCKVIIETFVIFIISNFNNATL